MIDQQPRTNKSIGILLKNREINEYTLAPKQKWFELIFTSQSTVYQKCPLVVFLWNQKVRNNFPLCIKETKKML